MSSYPVSPFPSLNYVAFGEDFNPPSSYDRYWNFPVPSTLTGSRGQSSSAVKGSPPAGCPYFLSNPLASPMTTALTRAQSHYNDSRIFVDDPKPFNSSVNPPYQQPALARVSQNFFSAPPGLSIRAMVPRSPAAQAPTCRNPRRSGIIASSPYLPGRASSSQFQAVPPTGTAVHICQWRKDDNAICGELITKMTVSEHLVAHGVEKMARDLQVSCRWQGCRPRAFRGKNTINRECIVRHVRERHLGCRRSL